MTHDKELEILENIYLRQGEVRQRDLARIAGLSLGMTNSILKRLVTKGWLSIRKINNRNIRYIVSARGIDAITRKSYRYFKRTIKNVVLYKEAINGILHNARERGFSGVVLVGKSDLDFIVEHCCRYNSLDYVKDEPDHKGKVFYFYAESYIPDNATEEGNSMAFMQSVLMENGKIKNGVHSTDD